MRLHISRTLRIIIAVAATAGGSDDAHAQGVTITRAQATRALWVANAQSVIHDRRDFQRTAQIAVLLRAYEQNPSMPALNGIRLVTNAENAWQRDMVQGRTADLFLLGKTQQQTVDDALDVIGSVRGAEVFARGAKLLYHQYAHAMQNRIDQHDRVQSAIGMSHTYNSTRQYELDVLQKAYDLAQSNAEFASVLDIGFSAYFDARASDSEAELLANRPELGRDQLLQSIFQSIQRNGSATAQLEDLQRRTQSNIRDLRDILEGDTRTLADISAQQSDVLAYIGAEQLRRQAETRAAQEEARIELKLDAARSGVYILSTFIGMGNPRLGNDLQTTGGAVIQVVEAVRKYAKSSPDLEALSSVILTGNVLGAMTQLFSLFGPDQATPEQMILAQIDTLRRDVATLRVEMHDRFDRIDRSLNSIFEVMQLRFDAIDVQLGTISASQAEIQQTLANLASDLQRVERNLFAVIVAAADRPLIDDIDEALGFRERTGSDLAFDRFTTFESHFYSWAMTHAADPAAAIPAPRSVTDATLFTELGQRPLDANINILFRALDTRAPDVGLARFAAMQLPNPTQWALGAVAYATMVREWPSHGRRMSPERLDRIAQRGQVLRDAFTALSVRDRDGTHTPNRILYDSLLARYDSRLAILKDEIDAFSVTFLQRITSDVRDRAANGRLDLWGTGSQSTGFVPHVLSWSRCDAGTPAIVDLPGPRPDSILSNEARLFEQVGLGALRPCLDGISFGSQQVFQPYGCAGCNRVNETYGQLQLTFLVKATTTDGKTLSVFSHPHLFSRREMIRFENPRNPEFNRSIPPHDYLLLHWTSGHNLVAEVERGACDACAANGDTLRARIDTFLRATQRALYVAIVTQFGTASRIQAASRELSGIAQLMRSTAILGLPRTLQVNELLTGLLFGNQAILDGNAIANLYADGLQAIEGQDTANVPQVDFRIAAARSSALKTALSEALSRVRSGTPRETNDVVESAMRALADTRASLRQP